HVASPLSLHDALPISAVRQSRRDIAAGAAGQPAIEHRGAEPADVFAQASLFAHLPSPATAWARAKKSSAPKLPDFSASATGWPSDRKSTRLNSSHVKI